MVYTSIGLLGVKRISAIAEILIWFTPYSKPQRFSIDLR